MAILVPALVPATSLTLACSRGSEAPQLALPKQKDPLRPTLTHEDEAADDR